MAKLPSRDDLAGLPSARSGRPIASADTSAIGRGVANFGAGVSAIATAVTKHEDQASEFEAERRFQEFKWNQQLALEETMKGAEPGKVDGFSDQWAGGYREKAKEFLAEIPDAHKSKYDQKLFGVEREFYGAASSFMRNEQKRSSLNALTGMKDNVFYKRASSPEDIAKIREDYNGLIQKNPYLSPIEKDEILRKTFTDLERAHVLGRLERGDDTDAVIRDIRGGVLDADENPETRAKPFTEAVKSLPQQAAAPRKFSPAVDKAIQAAVQKYGVDQGLMTTFAAIESGGDPSEKTGSYKGLFQLSDDEFAKYGGKGNIFDVAANADAAAAKIKAESAEFQKKYGRAPTALDLYMVHQQGEAGYEAHMSSPEDPAWLNMAATGEGKKKGMKWAKAAIWGNIPDDVKSRFPDGVESVTSGQFVEIWREKVERFGGGQVIPMPKAAKTFQGPYQLLSVNERESLVKTAQSKQRAGLEAEREQLKRMLDDETTSLRETGVGVSGYDLERAKRVLEPNQINTHIIQRAKAVMEYEASHDLHEIDNNQLHRRLSDISPKAGEKNYDMKSDVHKKVEQKISHIVQERERDPARAVDRLPKMAELTKAARENPDDPEAIQALVRARLDAQEKLNIPEGIRSPITLAEAKDIIAPTSKLDGKALKEAMPGIIAKIEERYGPYAAATGSRAIQMVVHNKELADEVWGHVSKSLKGMPIKSSSIRRLELLNEIAASERAFGPAEMTPFQQYGLTDAAPAPKKRGSEQSAEVFEQYGMPVKVQSVDDARRLAPGTRFYDPNGILRVR